MFFPLLLHFLPLFLLPYLLTLCKNNKKKKVQYKPSRRRAIRKKQKTSSTTTTDKLDSPLPENEKKKREKIAKNEKKKKSQKMVKSQKKEKEKEEMSKNRKDSLLEEQAKTIRSLQKAFDSRPFVPPQSYSTAEWKRMDAYRRQNFLDDQSLQRAEHSEKFEARLLKDYGVVHKIYEEHKCPAPVKIHGREDACPVCAAYMEWAGWHCAQGFKDDRYPNGINEKLEGELYNYGGPLPSALVEHPRWKEAKKKRKQAILEEDVKNLEATQESEQKLRKMGKEEEEKKDGSSSEEEESEEESKSAVPTPNKTSGVLKRSLKVEKTQESDKGSKKEKEKNR